MPSEAYDRALAEATRHHARSKTYSGRFLRPHKPWLEAMARRLELKSALDYGCGKGAQYEWRDPTDGRTIEEALGFEVRKYDPAWPPFANEPPSGVPFDLVIVTHVLGSIPNEDMGWVLERVFDHAEKAVFIAEKIGEPKKKVFSRPGDHPFGLHAIDWIELIMPHRRPGLEVHLSVNYRAASGEAFVGRFQLA